MCVAYSSSHSAKVVTWNAENWWTNLPSRGECEPSIYSLTDRYVETDGCHGGRRFYVGKISTRRTKEKNGVTWFADNSVFIFIFILVNIVVTEAVFADVQYFVLLHLSIIMHTTYYMYSFTRWCLMTTCEGLQGLITNQF